MCGMDPNNLLSPVGWKRSSSDYLHHDLAIRSKNFTSSGDKIESEGRRENMTYARIQYLKAGIDFGID